MCLNPFIFCLLNGYNYEYSYRLFLLLMPYDYDDMTLAVVEALNPDKPIHLSYLASRITL